MILIYCRVNIFCYGVLFHSDVLPVSGILTILPWSERWLSAPKVWLFTVLFLSNNEQSVQLKQNSKNRSPVSVCLLAVWKAPNSVSWNSLCSPLPSQKKGAFSYFCSLAAEFFTDSYTLPFTPCESWCCPQHSTQEGTACVCTYVTSATGTVPSYSGTQL